MRARRSRRSPLRRGRLVSALLFALAVAGCGGSSPNPFTPPSGSDTGTLSGTIVGYFDRAPVGGATVVLGTRAAVADAQGRFTFTNVPAAGGAVVTANVTGYLLRGVGVSLSQAAAGVSIDVIRETPPFDLTFYREFARNAFESPFQLQTLKPWTRAPSFYVKLVVDGTTPTTTTRVSDQVVNGLRELFARSVPELSGGKFQMGAFETGDATRPAQDGWVNVTFHETLGAAFARSSVGGNSGTMDIRYGIVSSPTTNPNNCLTPEIALADHEITHTMGYWHTQNTLPDTLSGPGCPGTRPAHVKVHAAIVYSRPVGNRDPDVDAAPATGVLAPGAGTKAVVSCHWSQFQGR